MIIIAGTVPIDPAKKEDALAAMQAMQSASQGEAGCIHYHFYTNPWNEGEILVFEAWEDAQCLEAHSRSDHMDRFRDQIQQYVTGKMALTHYEVSDVRER